jgi:hypothetical protein
MDTTLAADRSERDAAKPARRMVKRAVWASLIAITVTGCGYLWQQASSARTTHRAEQARVEALQLTLRKMQALEREANLDAAARAYAERAAAERALRETSPDTQPTVAAPQTHSDPNI